MIRSQQETHLAERLAELHHAIDEYHTLIRDIEAFGLETEVRHGYGTAVLVLVRIPRNKLGNEVYRSRVKDWLFGIVHVRPLGDSSTVVDAETPSEEIRSIFHLVTWTKEQGGAGVTANFGQWEHITASFAPHAWSANKRLLKQLAAKIILGMDDLDQIKALFGEKVKTCLKSRVKTLSNSSPGRVLLCLYSSLLTILDCACDMWKPILAFFNTVLGLIRRIDVHLGHRIRRVVEKTRD